MNIEDRIIGRINRKRERREELPPVIAQAHEKAVAEVLGNPDHVIQEADFAQVYGEEAVQADTAEADRIEAHVSARRTPEQKNAKIIAETLEAIVLMQAEQSEWLGDAQTLKTARYDDYKNKVDMLAEWYSPETGSRLLALAVDVTFGLSTVAKKLVAIKEEIDSGKLGSIRYFKDSRGDFMGTRNNVPRTIIGISQERVGELAQLWLANKQRALGAHPVQALFLEEIETQLTLMKEYAERIGKQDIALAFEQALATIRPLKADKQQFAVDALRNDPVAVSIFEEARAHFKS